ncbi:lipopolysaccharide biosynthesis protein [Polaribacter marinivivus]|uniref:Lipopolysaccharide biosynthesis protein n=1 Tax=Polaribacter marinivivus TaxID=1524260 RepID=A0ABV8RCP9_9FLAO
MNLKDILSNFGINSERTFNITKHIGLSFIFKFLAIVSNFLLVPLTLDYLGSSNYGVWLVITSFIGWFTFFDAGLGHGLRNRFTEAKAKGDISLARAYISSAYFTLGLICLVLITLFFSINFFIDWTQVFNTSKDLQDKISFLMLIVFSFFTIQLVFKLITTIYTADQKPSISVIVNFLTQITSLVAVFLLLKYSKSSLVLFGLIFSFIPVVIFLIFNLLAFKGIYKDYRPTIKLWKKNYVKDIFGLGINFFIIQIAAVILYTTDNLIITHLFSPKDVVPYNLAFKYFSILSMSFSIIVTPYWSAITDAYTKEDYSWIKKSIRSLMKISLGFSIICVIMVIIADQFYVIWVGKEIVIPFKLTLFMALFVMLSLYIQPFTFFINGIGKIRVQLIIGVLMAIINIPLSIILVKYYGFGVSGVIFATILCSILGLIIYPIQYLKIINKKAKGIWNK